jgi:RsmE family RNA methyltransferase
MSRSAGHFILCNIPFFYIASYKAEKHLALDENTGRHIVQVLRMKKGDIIHLTDGKGHLLTCQIAETGKKNCSGSRLKRLMLQKEKTKSDFYWYFAFKKSITF